MEIAHFAISTFPQRRPLFSLIPKETNTPPFASAGRSGQEQDRRKEASDGIRQHREPAFVSGSLRIGMEVVFQAHHALETKFTFRLISGLENASSRVDRRQVSNGASSHLMMQWEAVNSIARCLAPTAASCGRR
ncbi:MAG: hypothetical protein NTW21_08150 [Verrucomicrobia bacterium]|nr:hypothetical protein [Verrucomicrobiota bacterium]